MSQVTEVNKIYRLSEKVHDKAGWKVGNIFLFLNIFFWSVLALVFGTAGICLAAGSIAGHGITLFCIVGYTGMIIGLFGGMYYLYQKEK